MCTFDTLAARLSIVRLIENFVHFAVFVALAEFAVLVGLVAIVEMFADLTNVVDIVY